MKILLDYLLRNESKRQETRNLAHTTHTTPHHTTPHTTNTRDKEKANLGSPLNQLADAANLAEFVQRHGRQFLQKLITIHHGQSPFFHKTPREERILFLYLQEVRFLEELVGDLRTPSELGLEAEVSRPLDAVLELIGERLERAVRHVLRREFTPTSNAVCRQGEERGFQSVLAAVHTCTGTGRTRIPSREDRGGCRTSQTGKAQSPERVPSCRACLWESATLRDEKVSMANTAAAHASVTAVVTVAPELFVPVPVDSASEPTRLPLRGSSASYRIQGEDAGW